VLGVEPQEEVAWAIERWKDVHENQACGSNIDETACC